MFAAGLGLSIVLALIGVQRLDSPYRLLCLMAAAIAAYSIGRLAAGWRLEGIRRALPSVESAQGPAIDGVASSRPEPSGESVVLAPAGAAGQWPRLVAVPIHAALLMAFFHAPGFPGFWSEATYALAGIGIGCGCLLVAQRWMGLPIACLWVSQDPEGIKVVMPWKEHELHPHDSRVSIGPSPVAGRLTVLLFSPGRVWKLDLPRETVRRLVARWQATTPTQR